MDMIAGDLRADAKTGTGPIDHYLASLHTRLKDLRDGEVAAYIPELAKADPDLFGIAIATVDGKVYAAGDSERAFTIQSTSKPFIYGHILSEYGREAVLKHRPAKLSIRSFSTKSKIGRSIRWSTRARWPPPS